jgi:hypothetical protein
VSQKHEELINHLYNMLKLLGAVGGSPGRGVPSLLNEFLLAGMAALVSDLQCHDTAVCWDGFDLAGTRAISDYGPAQLKPS